MVIFNSYVKLPEGIWWYFDVLKNEEWFGHTKRFAIRWFQGSKWPVLKRVLEPMWLLALSGREPCVNAWSFLLVFMCQICSASLGSVMKCVYIYMYYIHIYIFIFVCVCQYVYPNGHEFLMWQWATRSFRLSAARMIQLNISNCSLKILNHLELAYFVATLI